MADTDKTEHFGQEEQEAVSRNFIEQMIDKDLEDGVYDCVHTRFPPCIA